LGFQEIYPLNFLFDPQNLPPFSKTFVPIGTSRTLKIPNRALIPPDPYQKVAWKRDYSLVQISLVICELTAYDRGRTPCKPLVKDNKPQQTEAIETYRDRTEQDEAKRMGV
jgi:hypothetical protein